MDGASLQIVSGRTVKRVSSRKHPDKDTKEKNRGHKGRRHKGRRHKGRRHKGRRRKSTTPQRAKQRGNDRMMSTRRPTQSSPTSRRAGALVTFLGSGPGAGFES